MAEVRNLISFEYIVLQIILSLFYCPRIIKNISAILGTFLLIYFIAMFGCGIPIFFQEVATGQYLGSGGLTMIGQLVPMLQGTFLT